METQAQEERGYVMVGVMILLALGLIVSAGMLNSSATNAKARALVTTQADYYYQVETTLNAVVGWLQQNSKNLVTGFDASHFGPNFDTGSPAVGDNEGQFFNVPTMVKMKGTNDSVILSNNPSFGTPAFPATTNIDTNAPFDAVSEFQNADLGQANARIVLVWARETAGNYEPIFRIDVMTGNNPDRGVHSFSYVYSTLQSSNNAMQFYGRDSLTLNNGNNECYSYSYTYDAGTSTWSNGAPRSNCGVASDNTTDIGAKVHGNAYSLLDPGVNINGPSGDVSGNVCEGAGCHGYVLPVVNTYAGYCPTGGPSYNIKASDPDLTLNTGGCYGSVQIANNKTVTLTDTSTPYYFSLLDFKANFAKIAFGNIPQGQKVTVYVDTVNNDHLNGNVWYNPNNAPHQVELFYIGTNNFKLNGTAALNMFFTAPNADVEVLGNFNYYGGIWAKSLTANGNARLWGDEEVAGVPSLNDIKFALRKTSQRYR